MTEAKWLDFPAIRFLEDRVSDRKLRLFACACAKRLWEEEVRLWHNRFANLFSDLGMEAGPEQLPPSIVVAEALADGHAASEEVAILRATAPARLCWEYFHPGNAATIVAAHALEEDAFSGAVSAQSDCALGFGSLLERGPWSGTGPEYDSDVGNARARDIFGNPFRPARFSPSWRTDTAVSLARGMYEAREFSAMPILADALQDAGCDNEDILTHCRDTSPAHVRGCWVVDLVLGRE